MLQQHTTTKILSDLLIKIENELENDVISYTGPITQTIKGFLKKFIENISSENKNKRKITVILTTSGGTAEGAEDIVNILRENYDIVDFIVPDYAMSAGTILCMSGDNIYMDYSSTLGPIDPQIPSKDGTSYIPASGYLDKVNELIDKERKGIELTRSELNMVIGSDIGLLKFIEQAKQLTVTLLKDWLVKYKFKDWIKHRGTRNPEKAGDLVTIEEKENRAKEIAEKLGDVSLWHTHGRSINIYKLRDILALDIIDLKDNQNLYNLVKEYYDILGVVAPKNSLSPFLHSRNFI